MHGIDAKEHAKALVEIERLNQMLDQIKNETNEEKQKDIAKEVSAVAEALLQNEGLEFSGWKLIELAEASEIAGNLEIAEGQIKQAKRIFEEENDNQGLANRTSDWDVCTELREILIKQFYFMKTR